MAFMCQALASLTILPFTHRSNEHRLAGAPDISISIDDSPSMVEMGFGTGNPALLSTDNYSISDSIIFFVW